MMMQYASLLTKWNEVKSFMSTALLQGRDGECHLKNTCKFLAAGDSIFLLTFNLLYMLHAVNLQFFILAALSSVFNSLFIINQEHFVCSIKISTASIYPLIP